MATSKTLTPTGVTIQIPEFTDQPDQRVNSNCIDKEADAINALNSKFITISSGSLHDIRTAGVYYCTASVTNKPVSAGGLYVLNIANNAYLGGIYVPYDGTAPWSVSMNGNGNFIYNELALNSKIAQSVTSATSPSGVSATANVVVKQLNVVWFHFVGSKTQWAEGDLISTIPTGYRPTYAVHAFATSYNMPSDNVQIVIGTDGEVKIWNKGTQAAGNIYIDATWII